MMMEILSGDYRKMLMVDGRWWIVDGSSVDVDLEKPAQYCNSFTAGGRRNRSRSRCRRKNLSIDENCKKGYGIQIYIVVVQSVSFT